MRRLWTPGMKSGIEGRKTREYPLRVQRTVLDVVSTSGLGGCGHLGEDGKGEVGMKMKIAQFICGRSVEGASRT